MTHDLRSAGRGQQQCRENFKECGLAGAVVPENPDDAAGLDGKAHRFKGDQRAKAARDSIQLRGHRTRVRGRITGSYV